MIRAARAGFTLIELMIALVLSAIVLGSMYKVLNNNQRFYRAQSEVTEVQENLRAIGLILPGELRELSASDGDIISKSDTSIEIRAARVFGIACATPVVGSGYVVIRNGLTFGYRAPDATRDSALVYRDGDPDVASDDRWLKMGLSAATTSGITCSDGSAGTRLTTTGPTASLDSVYEGAPVRTFEHVRYRVYDDGTGAWWLGVQSMVSGSWSAISPIAGPLQGSGNGIKLTYYDGTGAVTATSTSVALIQITARGKSTNQINVTGRPRGYYQDSLVTRVALRNN